MKSAFAKQVYDAVKKIPKGKTLTYKQVAIIAGRPNAFRAVGTILSKNTDKEVPCHRVIRSDGKVGGYNAIRGLTKRQLLLAEGAIV
jgi:O-6-methylguanine DNA methyltransferase